MTTEVCLREEVIRYPGEMNVFILDGDYLLAIRSEDPTNRIENICIR